MSRMQMPVSACLLCSPPENTTDIPGDPQRACPRAQGTATSPSVEAADGLASELNAAVRNSEREKVLELLEEGADVNSKVGSGWTPLQSAVQAGDKDMVQLLLDRGACPHARKDNGATAFIVAAIVGSVEILELLFGYGVDVNDCDNNGFTAFMEAAWYGNEEALSYLHSKGADVNMRRVTSDEKKKLNKGGRTALMDACRNGCFSIVRTLVQEMGADLNICDNEDRNALIHALKVDDKKVSKAVKVSIYVKVSIVHFLLDCGVNVRCKDESGKTALILAVEMQNPCLVKAFLDKDEINIDDADEGGKTALMVAVEKNDYDIAEMLCEKGARTDVGELIPIANRNYANKMQRLLRKYNAKYVPASYENWEPKSKRWSSQLQSLHETYRPMIGKLKVFQYIRQRIQSTSRGGIYLGLHGGTEVAVRILLSAEGSKEKEFLDQCGDCEHLLKLFQFEKERGYMYLCFPLWEKNLEEHLQDPEDEKDYKGILKMIFQAVKELHSLGFAHQALHPRNFLIDLAGKIYLADFDNNRELIEDKKKLISSDLEDLSRLVLYVLAGGRKPLCEVSIEDLDADSPDYEEALDLIERLDYHDEQGWDGLSKHPYFWSKQTFKFLKSIWNKIKDLQRNKDPFKALNARSPYPCWTEKIHPEVLHNMEKSSYGNKIHYKNSVTDLLRFMRNLDEHPNKRIDEITGDYAEYFLKHFPALTIYVYNCLRRHPNYSHFVDIQDPPL
ncbi:2-5A-dependent ribonuclease isoform X2 [Oxyura jamaicensis]|uniref:2-5A-dependent ribonuclease isoform X2 n=1 Tax=Oxyura jamaicensis TaxID=8884 RepID=UPI0015A52AD9|nr:2-5A-dependent ribonuclease isoform X2 [Oxyura jamaicensis]